MTLKFEDLVETAEAHGFKPIHMGTMSCPYFGVDFGDRIVGVDTESVCVYEPEAFHGGTEELSSEAVPTDATAADVMEMVTAARTKPLI